MLLRVRVQGSTQNVAITRKSWWLLDLDTRGLTWSSWTFDEIGRCDSWEHLASDCWWFRSGTQISSVGSDPISSSYLKNPSSFPLISSLSLPSSFSFPNYDSTKWDPSSNNRAKWLACPYCDLIFNFFLNSGTTKVQSIMIVCTK